MGSDPRAEYVSSIMGKLDDMSRAAPRAPLAARPYYPAAAYGAVAPAYGPAGHAAARVDVPGMMIGAYFVCGVSGVLVIVLAAVLYARRPG